MSFPDQRHGLRLELNDISFDSGKRSMTYDSTTSTTFEHKFHVGGLGESGDKGEGSSSFGGSLLDLEATKQQQRQDPIITDGHDVSNYAISDEDFEEPALTGRSLILGTVVAGISATLNQIYIFKPVDATVSTVLLLLITYALGKIWAAVLPTGKRWRDQEHWGHVGRWMDAVNPGKFGLKEHVVATLLASTAASGGSSAITTFAVQKLFYPSNPLQASTVILTIFSTTCFGFGLVGILRPLTVYPAEMVYWANLPNVLTVQALHRDNRSSKRLRMFYQAMTVLAIWELFPQYIFPVLNGISLPCLFTQTKPLNIRRRVAQIFGGAEGNEGLGFLEWSFDWQYVGSIYLSLPLVQQANIWAGFAICYVAVVAVYFGNAWGARILPMLSTSLFDPASTPGRHILFNQTAVFVPPDNVLNSTALAAHGLPLLTAGYAWSLMCGTLAIGALLAHVVLFWGPSIRSHFRQHFEASNQDRHYVAMSKYSDAPWWWFIVLMFLSFVSGLIVVARHGSSGVGLTVPGYFTALLVGSFIAPFSNILFARMGSGIATSQLMKMLGGALYPGKPIANLYFSMWAQDVIGTSTQLASNFKIAQYLKIPPRAIFVTQIWGTLFGAGINYVVMTSIVSAQRSVLLDSQGSHVWTGLVVQNVNSQAITWSLGRQLFNLHSRYALIPFGLLLGMVPTTMQWLIWRRWPKIGPLPLNAILLPVIYQFSQWMTTNVSSVIMTTVLVGVVSQVWLRRRHPAWFRKYLYVLGGALDGGTQITVLVLSFAVFGAGGSTSPFPTWWGNPTAINNNLDYCVRHSTQASSNFPS